MLVRREASALREREQRGSHAVEYGAVGDGRVVEWRMNELPESVLTVNLAGEALSTAWWRRYSEARAGAAGK